MATMQKLTLEIKTADKARPWERVLFIEKAFATLALDTTFLHGEKVAWTADLQVLMGQKFNKPNVQKLKSLFERRINFLLT